MLILRILFVGLLLNALSFSVKANDSIRLTLDAWSAGYDKIIYEADIYYSEQLTDFYTENNYQPLWLNQTKLTTNGHKLLDAIKLISEEGLLPNDYHLNQLKYLDELIEINTEYDILLSDAYLLLSSHLLNGKVSPTYLKKEWVVIEKDFNHIGQLTRIKNNETVDSVLNSLKPKSKYYKKLKQWLTKLTRLPEMNWDQLALKPAIKINMSDPRIPLIREKLLFWGDYTLENPSEMFDGEIYDDETYDSPLFEAIEKFQIRHGLDTDGIIGKQTLEALNLSVDDQIKKIKVNLERFRWQKNVVSENRIEVNIAEFNLRVYLNNQLVMEKPVIVGKNYRKTPVFDDQLKYLVFNPTWTVPQRLINEDKLPQILKDPDYLDNMEFKLFEIGTSTAVDPKSVDWTAVTKKNFPFRMVQSPGDKNALGQVKFMFPNSFDVYLHDTPARELFNKSGRAFSSGCIRVKDPIDLAELLLKNQSVERNKIDSILKSKETKTIYLTKPIAISLEYWTTWVDESNTLIVRNDIYGRDDVLFKALTQPLTKVISTEENIIETTNL